jgi:hypothetical protein
VFVQCGSELIFASINEFEHIAAAEEMAIDLARIR